MPVAWGELGTPKGADHWTVRTAHVRLDEGNTPWQGYARSVRSLQAAMKAMGFVPAYSKGLRRPGPRGPLPP